VYKLFSSEDKFIRPVSIYVIFTCIGLDIGRFVGYPIVYTILGLAFGIVLEKIINPCPVKL
jgi:hypothetical protein